jgi:hypothetical protein
MANALVRLNRHSEAATYFRIVNALRPGQPWFENTMGASLALAGATIAWKRTFCSET